MFCSDPISGSYFIAQTSKFLLVDATAVTLSGFDVRGKSCCGGGRGGGGSRGGNELKT